MIKIKALEIIKGRISENNDFLAIDGRVDDMIACFKNGRECQAGWQPLLKKMNKQGLGTDVQEIEICDDNDSDEYHIEDRFDDELEF